jgi:hypothetical protein
VTAQTSALLEAEEAERHRRVVIVVDEAHLLTPEQLEELRLLTKGVGLRFTADIVRRLGPKPAAALGCCDQDRHKAATAVQVVIERPAEHRPDTLLLAGLHIRGG